MANVLLGVTGSVAAIKTPDLYQALVESGHTVKIVSTEAGRYFFDAASIAAVEGRRDPDRIIFDEDEWPGADQGQRYARGDDVLHIELRRWADIFLIAPLDANTLAKIALGLADNCLTCVWRAWDRQRPRILAPAMNTLMWTAPATVRHLRQLAEDEGYPCPAGDWEAAVSWINEHCPRLRVVAPVEKKLACEDVGIGGLADLPNILAVINHVPVYPRLKVP